MTSGRLALTLALALAAVAAGVAQRPPGRVLADYEMIHMVEDCAGSSCQYAFFAPTTTVPVGTTIQFMNLTTAAHTATADDGSFNTGVMAADAIVNITFTRTGTSRFHCAIHPTMVGTLIVTSPAATPTVPPTTAATSPTAGTPAAFTPAPVPTATSLPPVPISRMSASAFTGATRVTVTLPAQIGQEQVAVQLTPGSGTERVLIALMTASDTPHLLTQRALQVAAGTYTGPLDIGRGEWRLKAGSFQSHSDMGRSWSNGRRPRWRGQGQSRQSLRS